jgi:ribose 1,5-bisphosphokinase
MARPLGTLVLVVGPSGVGKDTLIAGAKQALDADKQFVFVRRIVTRQAHAQVEDHDSLDPLTFLELEAADRFALSWEAHGLRYALPLSLETDIALGKVVVANVSRHMVAGAHAKYPNCSVILISAEISLRAERLTQRGREGRDQITARLARESAAVPAGIVPIVIDNSSSVARGVTAFVLALRRIAGE